MSHIRFSAGITREARLLHERESGFGEHMKDYWHDVTGTYVHAGFSEHDAIKKATGVIMVPASLLLEGTDQIYAGAVGQEYVAPKGPAGRIVRDTKFFVQDLVGLHPLKAAGDAFRVFTADVILDAGDIVGGHHQSYASMHQGVRDDIRQTILPMHEHHQQVSTPARKAA